MKILIFTLGLFLIYLNSYSQKNDSIKSVHDPVLKTNIVFGEKNDPYIKIALSKDEFIGLVKKNSTVENSLSVFICALGVLFTIMAIFVAIVIYAQSKDFKEKLSGVITKYEGIIKGFIDSKRADLKTQEESISQLLVKYEDYLKTAESEHRIQIEETINELKSKKEIVDKQLKNSVVDAEYILSDFPTLRNFESKQELHKCSVCNFGFIVRDIGRDYLTLSGSTDFVVDPITHMYSSEKIAKCPKCGNVDRLN